MSQYLTDEEILTYCTSQVGVNSSDVIIASHLIDGYLGKTFGVNEISETVNINQKQRGKLVHAPVVEIKAITELVITPLGVTRQEISLDNLILDIENDGYFTYIAKSSPFAYSFMDNLCSQNCRVRRLEVTYTYGYSVIPEDIKIVCSMLAQNIRQMQTFAGFKKLNTLDYTVEMANPSFFTSDMRIILDKYR